MKVSCQKTDLLKALTLIANVVNDRQTIPILSNTLLQASGQLLTCSATDLKIGLELSINAQVDQEGAITVPAKRLLTIVRELPDQPVQLNLKNNNTVEILCGNSEFKVLGLSQEEFPQIVHLDDELTVELEQKTLKDMLKKTSIAVSVDASRYVLTGIYCVFHNDQMIMVSTDGRRLSYVSQTINRQFEDEKTMIIPSKMTQELMKVLGDEAR